MEIKTDALVLKTAVYGESDKMATLFTAERGKIGARFKGVRKAGARLSFAAQPFCFAEYVLAERGGRYTVVSASLYDGFYSLREDVGSYYAACAVCETCDKLLYEGMVSGELLVAAVNALKETADGSSCTLVRFLLSALRIAGYPVRAGNCPVCGNVPEGRMRFDMESGAFLCEACGGGAPASEITYRTVLRGLQGADGMERDGVKRALRLLSSYLFYQTEIELSSLKEYLALI